MSCKVLCNSKSHFTKMRFYTKRENHLTVFKHLGEYIHSHILFQKRKIGWLIWDKKLRLQHIFKLNFYLKKKNLATSKLMYSIFCTCIQNP